AIYMPMVPEMAIALLACARIGAPHNVIFGGYSEKAIRDGVEDAKARVVITADGGWRRGRIVALEAEVDEALYSVCASVEQVVVYRRFDNPLQCRSERDSWWHELVEDMPTKHEPKSFDAERPLFILCTSGTTGSPKGVVHATAGYALWTKVTSRWVFDL